MSENTSHVGGAIGEECASGENLVEINSGGKRGLTSMVWRHFKRFKTPDDKQVAVCNHCKRNFVGNSGTSHLRNHLNRKHQELFIECERSTNYTTIEVKRSKTKAHRGKKENLSTPISHIMESMDENNKRRNDVVEKFLSCIAANVSVVAPSGRSSHIAGGDSVGQTDKSENPKITQAVECLGTLGITGATYAKAFNKICEDPIWAGCFISIPDERKKDVVESL